jgi:hypothetical protein
MTFNSGNVKSDGFTIALHFGMALDGNQSMDVTVGYDTNRGESETAFT